MHHLSQGSTSYGHRHDDSVEYMAPLVGCGASGLSPCTVEVRYNIDRSSYNKCGRDHGVPPSTTKHECRTMCIREVRDRIGLTMQHSVRHSTSRSHPTPIVSTRRGYTGETRHRKLLAGLVSLGLQRLGLGVVRGACPAYRFPWLTVCSWVTWDVDGHGHT